MLKPHNLPPLLEQLAVSPLLIDETMTALVEANIGHVVSHEHAQEMMSAPMAASNDDDFWPTTEGDWRAYYRPYNVKEGTLQIPVMGVLLHRFPYQLGRWATGYKYIEMAVKRGLEDDNVKRIAFVIDSPGGEVAGCFELTDLIYESRGKKPMRSFAADHCYSAAFSIGSATGKGRLSVTRSGGVGSVGVITMHVEYSEALKQAGIKVTYVYKGAHKKDGNPYEPLSKDAQARMDKRIEKLYSVFVNTVARNRGMEEKAVRETEALTYDAEDGIAVGFADRLGALDDEMALFAEDTSAGDETMANTYTQEQYDAAVATAKTEGHAAGKAEGVKEGTAAGETAASTRLNAILDSEEGKKRPKAALNAATKTKMSAEEAVAFLATLDEEKPAAKAEEPKPQGQQQTGKPGAKTEGSNHFADAMKNGNPDVGGGDGGEGEGEGDETASNVSSILGAYGNASGVKKTA